MTQTRRIGISAVIVAAMMIAVPAARGGFRVHVRAPVRGWGYGRYAGFYRGYRGFYGPRLYFSRYYGPYWPRTAFAIGIAPFNYYYAPPVASAPPVYYGSVDGPTALSIPGASFSIDNGAPPTLPPPSSIERVPAPSLVSPPPANGTLRDNRRPSELVPPPRIVPPSSARSTDRITALPNRSAYLVHEAVPQAEEDLSRQYFRVVRLLPGE